MKRTIPLLITAIGGFILMASLFNPYTESWGEVVSVWFDIIASIAFILGGGNLLKIHLKKTSDAAPGWGYSVVTLISFAIMLVIGLGKINVPAADKYPNHPWSGEFNAMGTPFWWLYEYGFKPLTATMFAMLAFYVASAAFRAFRAKNVEATLLLGTAFIILLGRTFAGVWLTSWIDPDVHTWMPHWFTGLRIENLTVTIMGTLNTAGSRAIMIGIALGIASTSLRVILGVDRSYLGSGD